MLPSEEYSKETVKFHHTSKTKFISFLNRKQNDFALGKLGNQKASNLSVIVWDDELEKFAVGAGWKLGRFQFSQDFCFDTSIRKNNEYNIDDFGRGNSIDEIIDQQILSYDERMNSRFRYKLII